MNQLKHIPIGKVIVRKNVRRDDDKEITGLAESIEEHDLLQPILVRPEGDKFLLIAGHRRLRAVKASGEIFISAYVRDDITDAMIPIIQLSENVQRKQMKPWELVEVFDEMKRTIPGMNQRKIAKLLGKTEFWVSNKYRAARVFEKLIADGMAEEEIEDFSENVLIKLKAGKIRASGNRAESKPHRKYDYTGGFEMLVPSGSKKIIIMFRDELKMNRVLNILREEKGEGSHGTDN